MISEVSSDAGYFFTPLFRRQNVISHFTRIDGEAIPEDSSTSQLTWRTYPADLAQQTAQVVQSFSRDILWRCGNVGP